ncbi:MAG: hypothetical protein KH828_09835 [Clostridiales bacterium]|nr:hypothetical protein [Clostridiales bacterium]
MKRMLRKSTENQMASTYITMTANGCGCTCLNHCGVEVSSWYPQEAHTSVDVTVNSRNSNA